MHMLIKKLNMSYCWTMFYCCFAWILMAGCCSADLQTPSESSDFSSIPQYHLPMLNDQERNHAYKLAIQKGIVANKTVVLDLGAGTGLLSLYAASAQAKQVIAIEHNSMLYEIGQAIVSDNHLDDRIVFYHMDSREVDEFLSYDTCKELERRTGTSHDCDDNNKDNQVIDLVVTELFDSWILGEFIFTALGDLYERRIIDTNTKVIPSQGNLYIQLVQSAYSFHTLKPHSIDGYDYSAYGRYNLYTFNEIIASVEHDVSKHLSDVVNVFNFTFEPSAMIRDSEHDFDRTRSFNNPYYHHRYQQVLFHINETDVIHGVLFWFDLWMDQEQTIKLSNEPYVTKSHWKQMFLPLKNDFIAYQDTYLSVQIAQLPRRYVVLSNHGKHRMLKIVSMCEMDENEGMEIYARYKLTDNGGVDGSDVDDSADINCFDDVANPLQRKKDCPTARLLERRTQARNRRAVSYDNNGRKSNTRRNVEEDVVEEEFLFNMDGTFKEFNYWKGYMGQEFVAVIKLPTKGRGGRSTTIRRYFTIPHDNYRYNASCTERKSCNSNQVELAVFNIYCSLPNAKIDNSRRFISDL